MKTLILYATKNGAAREAAQRIAGLSGSAVLHDLKGGVPPLADYDCIILGSSVYVGSIRKEAKAFLKENTSVLLGKRLGLFLCGMDASNEQASLKANFPQELLQSAKAASFLGGIFDPKKAGVMGRLIMKVAVKQSEYTDTIDNGKIKQFTEAMLV